MSTKVTWEVIAFPPFTIEETALVLPKNVFTLATHHLLQVLILNSLKEVEMDFQQGFREFAMMATTIATRVTKVLENCAVFEAPLQGGMLGTVDLLFNPVTTCC